MCVSIHLKSSSTWHNVWHRVRPHQLLREQVIFLLCDGLKAEVGSPHSCTLNIAVISYSLLNHFYLCHINKTEHSYLLEDNTIVGASQVVLVVKNTLLANAGGVRDAGWIPGSGIMWVAWQPTPVFFPEESHGQRSLAGYRP